MRIAQIAPLYESVPPKLYGGTERIVSYLTEELVAQGHDVTLFASGDSITRARLIPCAPESLRLDPKCVDKFAHHILMLEEVLKRSSEFDIVHFHIDYLHFPLSRRSYTPQVTTLHGRLDIRDLVPLYREFREMPVVSISDAQRSPLPWLNWQATIHHGLPRDLYRFHPKTGQYLAFLGRISPEKGVDQAIAIAKRVGIKLKIAAKVDPVDQEYFERVIRPLMDSSLIEYIGEIGEQEKDEFLGNALALLLALNWPEPFGVVMIEALACGTPIVAFRAGSVFEIIEDGATGFIVDSAETAVAALNNVPALSRRRCRRAFETRFTAARMCRDYLSVYEGLQSGDAFSAEFDDGMAAALGEHA
jgi:glycosyltransferase involved in cell wall biosynthesis